MNKVLDKINLFERTEKTTTRDYVFPNVTYRIDENNHPAFKDRAEHRLLFETFIATPTYIDNKHGRHKGSPDMIRVTAHYVICHLDYIERSKYIFKEVKYRLAEEVLNAVIKMSQYAIEK